MTALLKYGWLIGLILALPAQAQTPGRLAGTVVTARGQTPVPGINVVIVGTLFGAVTDAAGRYAIASVPPGDYTVQVNALGFQPEMQRMSVTAGAETVVDFQLRLPEAALENGAATARRGAGQPAATLEERRLREINAQDAGRFVRAMPGVYAGRRGALALSPNVRGLSESQVGVYVEGARYLPGSPYGPDAPLSLFAPRFLESIEAVQGPYALTWGAGNLSALRAATRGAPPPGRPRGTLEAGYTSNQGAYDANGTLAGATGNLSYRLLAAYRAGGDYDDGAGRAVPAAFSAADARGRLDYQVAPATRLTVAAGYQDQQDVDAPGRLLDLRTATATNASVRFQTARAAGLLRLLDAQASWNRFTQASDNGSRRDPEERVVFVDSEHTYVGGRLAARLVPSQQLTLDVGVDAYHARDDADRGFDGRALLLPGARLTNVGLFVHGVRTLGRVEASGVVRLDVVRARADRPDETILQQTGLTENPDADETNVSGALTLSTQLTPSWRVSAGLGSVARSADAIERYANGLPFRRTHRIAAIRGFPSLAPERSTQADLWLDADYPRLDLRLSGFARRLDDAITLGRPPLQEPPFPDISARYANGKATFFGAEATAAYALMGEYVTLHAGASYLWGRDELREGPAFGVAPPSARVGLRLDAPANLFFLEGTLHGAARQTRVATWLGEAETDGYVTADLRLGVSLPRSGALLLGLDNLADAAYAHHLNAQRPLTGLRLREPGRQFFARLRIGL